MGTFAASAERPRASGACRIVSALTIIAVIVTTAAGCTGLDPVQPASGGTWTVGYHTGWGRYSVSEEMNHAMKAASDYCLARGQQMGVIDTEARDGGLRMSYASVHFRCTAQTAEQ